MSERPNLSWIEFDPKCKHQDPKMIERIVKADDMTITMNPTYRRWRHRLSPLRVAYRDGYMAALTDLTGRVGAIAMDRLKAGGSYDEKELAAWMFDSKNTLMAFAWNGELNPT